MSETSTLYFPGQGKNDGWIIYPEVGSYSCEPEDLTWVLESVGGSQQRRMIWPLGGRAHIIWRTMKLTASQSQQVRDFLRSLRGRGLAFNFFDFLRQSYYKETCGTADGSSTLVVPFRGLRNVTHVYRSGPPETELSGWTITANVGDGGEDRFNWAATYPANGQTITFTGEGFKRYVVTKEADRQAGKPFAGGETWNDAVAAADLQFDLSFVEMI